MLPIVNKVINIQKYRIEDFDHLKTESDLILHLEANKILKQDDKISNSYFPFLLEIYYGEGLKDEFTTVIIDINGILVGYNNGKKGSLIENINH